MKVNFFCFNLLVGGFVGVLKIKNVSIEVVRGLVWEIVVKVYIELLVMKVIFVQICLSDYFMRKVSMKFMVYGKKN